MCSVSIYCVSNNQMRGLLDVVLVEVEMVDAVVGRVVVTVVVRITSPLRCNHLMVIMMTYHLNENALFFLFFFIGQVIMGYHWLPHTRLCFVVQLVLYVLHFSIWWQVSLSCCIFTHFGTVVHS